MWWMKNATYYGGRCVGARSIIARSIPGSIEASFFMLVMFVHGMGDGKSFG